MAIELSPSNRTSCIDRSVAGRTEGGSFKNYYFLRLNAKKAKFESVDFKYTIFDTCYFRGCTFDSCDFTGCRFVATILSGAKFSGCKFDYATFERTFVDHEILESSFPGPENLRMRFARSLRVNFQQVGDAQGANLALSVELEATGEHLKKAWRSKESYYRNKYSGIRRFFKFLEYVRFRSSDALWGNGESIPKLFRSIVALVLFMAAYDCNTEGKWSIAGYWAAWCDMSAAFVGCYQPQAFSHFTMAVITFLRLVAVGAFVSIVVKRHNKR